MKRLCLSTLLLFGLGIASAEAQIVAPSPESKAPAVPAYRPPSTPAAPYVAPVRPIAPVTPSGGGIGGNDPAAQQVERTLPLDPATRNLQNRMPPNPGQVARQLGLREPSGPVTDLRGHTPSPQEIVNGLNRH